jgi:hypothetical protein
MPDKPIDPAALEASSSSSFDVMLPLLGIMAMVIGLLCWIIWGFLPESFRDSAWYSVEYSVDWDQVHVEKFPTDCAWGHAPIGDKGCHYQQKVETLKNDRGVITDVFVTWDKVVE